MRKLGNEYQIPLIYIFKCCQGGNWGDYWTWKNLQLPRMQAFVILLEKGWTVVGLPQSLYYINQERAKNDSNNWRDSISKMKNPVDSTSKVHLTWRQRDSYEKSLSLYPFATNHLIPDTAFMIGPLPDTDMWSITKEKFDILFLMRKDKESVHKINKSMIQDILLNTKATKKFTFRITDWFGEKFEKIFSPNKVHRTSESLRLEYMVRIPKQLEIPARHA